jgi:ADP-ribosylglycohydrolase
MALSIVDELLEIGAIRPDELAERFARRYVREPWRGYGGGAQRLLSAYAQGGHWRELAPGVFPGGSYGNGGAMRAAPIGAFFQDRPEQAAEQGRRSAQVTHSHPEGQAGAMAVAAAASLVDGEDIEPEEFLAEIMQSLPESRTRSGIEEARRIPAEESQRAAKVLGTGRQIAAFDTVPFCLWVAAHHNRDYAHALWTTVVGRGDRDTTCAIVGGILGAYRPVPEEWVSRREPLPPGYSP